MYPFIHQEEQGSTQEIYGKNVSVILDGTTCLAIILREWFTCHDVKDCIFACLPLKKWMLIIIYWWAKSYPVTDCMDEAEVDRHSVIDIYQWLHEVYTTHLLRDPPIVLGGQGVVVQVDESLFHHEPKVQYKAC